MSSKGTEKYFTWNSDTDYALGLCKFANQLLGIWPFDCQSLFSKIRLIAVFTSQVILFVHCIREIGGSCIESHDVVIVGMTGLCVLVTIKIAVLRINRNRLEVVIRSIAEDWKNEEDPTLRKIMRSYASLGRTVFIFQMVVVFLAISLMVLDSLPNLENIKMATISSSSNSSTTTPANLSDVTARDLPMGSGCFVADLPTILYVAYYIFQIVQLVIIGTGNVGNDVYFLCITLHVCGQFELLKERLEKFGAKQDITSCREELGKLVRRYNHLMTLATYFEDIFNPIIFGILAVNALHMSLLGLQIIICIKEGEFAKATEGVFSIEILSLQLFLYSYAGEYLSLQDERIREAAYNCSWYDLPPTIVRDIIIIIMKGGREFKLTAGKVFQMNFNNFKVIMKTMFSYFSMLRIMFNM